MDERTDKASYGDARTHLKTFKIRVFNPQIGRRLQSRIFPEDEGGRFTSPQTQRLGRRGESCEIQTPARWKRQNAQQKKNRQDWALRRLLQG